jgi:putative integral membrane protein (TIGR02587 family)
MASNLIEIRIPEDGLDSEIAIPTTREFLISVGRAFAGALLFALPILMTMEMWELGVTLHPWRIALLLTTVLPLLLGLSHFSGIRYTAHWRDEIADVLVAILVSSLTALIVLWTFGVISIGMPISEIISKLAMQFIPCSIGAMLARSQLGGSSVGNGEEREPSYAGELFLMMAGALFLSLSVAPTEETILIAFKMTTGQEILLVLSSLLVMQLFVYAAHFRGGHTFEGMSIASEFARFTVVGYVVVMAVSFCLLWLLGQIDGTSWREILSICVVLSFPGAIGAAAARLIL